MPVYLREERHRKVVDDTVRNIRQMSKDFELIIVDDGSPLSTEWLSGLATIYIKHDQNKGISAAWNTGKNEASADFVAIVNDDIKVPLRWLETLAGAFLDPETGISAPAVGNSYTKPSVSAPNVYEDYVFYPGYCFMLHRERFFEDFDEQFTSNCGDCDYWHRIKFANLRCMRVSMSVWHKEGGVLGGMDYDKISEESLRLWEAKHGFDPRKIYYS